MVGCEVAEQRIDSGLAALIVGTMPIWVAAMEAAGVVPRMVEGQRDNIKITVATDLALAALYLENREP